MILVAVLLSARQREFKRTILEARAMKAASLPALGVDAGAWCWCSSSCCSRRISPYFLSVDTLSDATFNFTERAHGRVAAGAADHRRRDRHFRGGHHRARVRGHGAGVGARRRHARASSASASAPGLLAGCINGALVTIGRVPSIVATIGTMTLFRGAAYAVLGDRVLKDYPESFAAFGQGYLVGPVSIELALFVLFAMCSACSCIARAGAARSSPSARIRWRAGSRALPVDRYRFALFALTGLFSGLAAVLLTSRLGSTRPSIAQGWELEIISMVILGGVSVWGGKGSIPGVVLAALVFGLVTFGLGLMNIPGIVHVDLHRRCC